MSAKHCRRRRSPCMLKSFCSMGVSKGFFLHGSVHSWFFFVVILLVLLYFFCFICLPVFSPYAVCECREKEDEDGELGQYHLYAVRGTYRASAPRGVSVPPGDIRGKEGRMANPLRRYFGRRNQKGFRETKKAELSQLIKSTRRISRDNFLHPRKTRRKGLCPYSSSFLL